MVGNGWMPGRIYRVGTRDVLESTTTRVGEDSPRPPAPDRSNLTTAESYETCRFQNSWRQIPFGSMSPFLLFTNKGTLAHQADPSSMDIFRLVDGNRTSRDRAISSCSRVRLRERLEPGSTRGRNPSRLL